MAERSEGEPVHRLVDMEVREVSLVDRAANKRRFLIVKRSDMGQEGSAGAGDQTDGEGDEGQDVDNDDQGHDAEAVLGVAATALEGLTDVMTRLQSADGDARRGELGNVVSELRAAADKLAAELGEDDGEGSQGDEDAEGDEGGEEPPPASGDSRFDALIGAMTSLVGELRATRTRKAGDDEEEEDDEEAPRPAPGRKGPKAKAGAKPPAPSSADQGLRGDIRALRGELKSMTGALQQQAQRLSRLEKRAGVPASRPAGERPASGRRDVERPWPLDLNAPNR